MPDLTIDEYRGLPREELHRILRQEAQKMREGSFRGARLTHTPEELSVSNAYHYSKYEKIFPSSIVLGLLALFRRYIVNQRAISP